MQLQTLKNILEALLLSADKPMDMRRLEALFEADEDRPGKDEIHQALQALQADYQDRGIQLKEVASGYRMQVVEDFAPWVARLWEEKPPRYSRALLETLVLIAYRQPITRGEIEDIRGVSVSSHIIKTLLEREWVRVLGHKDVPGKPAMYGTTREFLDYFSLKSLDELPPLSDIKDLDKLHPELALDDSAEAEPSAEGEPPAEGAEAMARGEAEADNQAAADEAASADQADAEDLEDAREDHASEDDASEDHASEVHAEQDDAEDDGNRAELQNESPVDGDEETEDQPPAGVFSEQTDGESAETGSDADAADPADATAEPRDQAPDETGEQEQESRSDGVSEDEQRAGREMQTG
jgi:segregation and condensation protein B